MQATSRHVRAEDPATLPYPPETEDPIFREPPRARAPEAVPGARYRITIGGLASDGPLPEPPPPSSKYIAPQVFYHGDTAKNALYLTIDDCNSPSLVMQAMDIAENAGARLTFFPVGNLIPGNPSLWRSVAERGHGIENHTYAHAFMSRQTESQIRSAIADARSALAGALGRDPGQRFLRPPGGDGIYNYDARIPRIAAELGYKISMWNSDSNGWRVYPRTDADAVAYVRSNVFQNFAPGSIVIQHALPVDILALPAILAEATRRGYTCITLQEGIE